MPKSFNEYHNKYIEGQKIFDSLPIDFKQEFGNNINAFMNSIYDKSFEERYKNYVSKNVVGSKSSVSSVADNNLETGLDKGGVENGK